MKKRVIFGGSFDPFTKAHLDVVDKLSKHFDEVIVVPAYISPFKPNGATLSGEDRLLLVKAETADYKNVTVSNFELQAKGTSYSYLTVEKFSSDDARLYFAIGSDGLGSLNKWANPDNRLKNAVTFFVIQRPYFPIKKDELELARAIYEVEVAPFIGEEGSSALLKVAVAFDKIDEVVPCRTAKVIKEKALYTDYEYITDRFDEFKITPKRKEHIYSTAKSAILLAKLNGADVVKATKSALLHDISKYLTEEDLTRYGVTEKAEYLPKSCRHQVTGALLAKSAYGETDEEILDAIKAHTTGEENMTLLQKIVFCADYIEENRSFSGVEEIRALTYADLNAGILAILKNTIEYLSGTGEEISPITQKVYDQLRSKNSND